MGKGAHCFFCLNKKRGGNKVSKGKKETVERLEKVEAVVPTIEVYENDIDFYLHQFQEEQEIDDMKTIPQTIWNACLMYIQRHLFTDRSMLKQKNNIYTDNTLMATNCNSYNYDLLNDICDFYIFICALYDKECSIYGYSKLVNIPYQTIMEWGSNYSNRERLSSKSFDLYKKLTDAREQSLVAKLVSMKHPTAMAIILNKEYSYNLPGVTKEHTLKNNTPEKLPDLR